MPDFDLDTALTPTRNTYFRYLYRDAGNWKTSAEFVCAGTVPDVGEFWRYLDGGEHFIAHDVGLDELQSQNRDEVDEEEDHVWHELVDVEETELEPTMECTAAEMLERFRVAHERGWDADAAAERLGFAF